MNLIFSFPAVYGLVAFLQLSCNICSSNAQVQNESKRNCKGTRTLGSPQKTENAQGS